MTANGRVCAALALLAAALSAPAGADSAAAAPPDSEMPYLQQVLARAQVLEKDADDYGGPWQAAILYCDAARLGSAEGQYRLGMLYAFGRGVPESRALAASLFSLAAMQGHHEAQNMLDTIAFENAELPPCVSAALLPEPAPRPPELIPPGEGALESRMAGLPKARLWLVQLVETLARWHEVDPRLVLSIIAVESNFQVKAVSPKAAMGLMQLIPATAERFNVKNAFDATQNIKGGIAYLRWLLAYYRGDVRLAVAAYNAGERAVDRHKGVPPYAETRAYVQRVLELYRGTHHPFDDRLTAPSPLIGRKG